MKIPNDVRSKHFDLEQIHDGVYAAIAVRGSGSVGNAGIVDLGDAVLIFDTFNAQQAAHDLRKAAEELTGDKPKYVVNSHWHGDHVRGNQVFADSTIIATQTTYDLMKNIHPERIQKQIDGLPELRRRSRALVSCVRSNKPVVNPETCTGSWFCRKL